MDDLLSWERGEKFTPVQLSPGLGSCYGMENYAVEQEGPAARELTSTQMVQTACSGEKVTGDPLLEASRDQPPEQPEPPEQQGRMRAVFLTFMPLVSLLLRTNSGS